MVRIFTNVFSSVRHERGRRGSLTYRLCVILLVMPILLFSVSVQIHAQSLVPVQTGPMPGFEVTTIKPSDPSDTHVSMHRVSSRITITHFTLRRLVIYAYGAKADSQVIGGPDWIKSRYFDIVASIGDEQAARLNTLSAQDQSIELQRMMQSLLSQRFGLRVTRENRVLPELALIQTKDIAKLTLTQQVGETKDASEAQPPKKPICSTYNTSLKAVALTMDRFAACLSSLSETEGRVIVNKTELPGAYDFTLEWAPESTTLSAKDDAMATSKPEFFTAISEQLGLRLKPDKAPVEVVVVQSAELPTPN